MAKTATKPKKKAQAEPRRSLASDAHVANLGRALSARYDSAQVTDENRRHLANADMLSAKAATDPAVRRQLRKYARYEVSNCPLARSVIRQQADYTVGTGPRLQVATRDRNYNRAVERAFGSWCIAINWSRKLWQLRYAKSMNGEAFAQFVTNPPLKSRYQPVTLDIRTIEADQIAEPLWADDTGNDGVVFDDYGNRAAYKVLKSHPGDTTAVNMTQPADMVRADLMCHYFDAERPGQVRGVPEITAALPYLSMRRRFILATIAAAETAADWAGIIKTQQSPDNADELAPLDLVDIERRSLMTLPMGWEIQQFKAEHPQTTLEMFDRVIIREVGRCVGMPYGIAGSDSSQYNFASGKLDHLPWYQSIRIEQDHIEDVVARPTFAKWFEEARIIPGYLPEPSEEFYGDAPPHKWFWDGQDLLDPREAGAKDIALKNGSETHARIFAKRGEDPVDAWEAEADLLGISLDEYRERVVESLFGGAASPPTNEDDDEQA